MRKRFPSLFDPKYRIVFLLSLMVLVIVVGTVCLFILQQVEHPSKRMKYPTLDDKNISFVDSNKTIEKVQQLQKRAVEIVKKEKEIPIIQEMRKLEEKPIVPLAYEEQNAPKESNKLPRLVIIIDDVSYDYDVAAIQSVGLPLVMSFLPPIKRHPESALLAQGVSGHMVHLPLEAMGSNGEEDGTLKVGDSVEKIAQTIQKIKKLYPSVRYINNHTGSKFTSDKASMERLLEVLESEGIIFVDSRTIGSTKAPEILLKQGKRYLHRDVFLDHHDGIANIKAQISKAVNTAKRNGTAVAIGHPRQDTIAALKQSRELLKQVQLVGIDKI